MAKLVAGTTSELGDYLRSYGGMALKWCIADPADPGGVRYIEKPEIVPTDGEMRAVFPASIIPAPAKAKPKKDAD